MLLHNKNLTTTGIVAGCLCLSAFSLPRPENKRSLGWSEKVETGDRKAHNNLLSCNYMLNISLRSSFWCFPFHVFSWAPWILICLRGFILNFPSALFLFHRFRAFHQNFFDNWTVKITKHATPFTPACESLLTLSVFFALIIHSLKETWST